MKNRLKHFVERTSDGINSIREAANKLELRISTRGAVAVAVGTLMLVMAAKSAEAYEMKLPLSLDDGVTFSGERGDFNCFAESGAVQDQIGRFTDFYCPSLDGGYTGTAEQIGAKVDTVAAVTKLEAEEEKLTDASAGGAEVRGGRLTEEEETMIKNHLERIYEECRNGTRAKLKENLEGTKDEKNWCETGAEDSGEEWRVDIAYNY